MELNLLAITPEAVREAFRRILDSDPELPMKLRMRTQKMNNLPATGFLRLSQIIGNPNAEPPIPAIIPVKATTWWNGVKSGLYPKPVKLGPRIAAWRVEDIRSLIDRLSDVSHVEKPIAEARQNPRKMPKKKRKPFSLRIRDVVDTDADSTWPD